MSSHNDTEQPHVKDNGDDKLRGVAGFDIYSYHESQAGRLVVDPEYVALTSTARNSNTISTERPRQNLGKKSLPYSNCLRMAQKFYGHNQLAIQKTLRMYCVNRI
jgi:hypothetical protein